MREGVGTSTLRSLAHTLCSPPTPMSTLTVWLYGCSCTSSGAMYSGVPLIDVRTIVLHDMARAKPKSHSLTVPCEPIRMFWGFMSLEGGEGRGGEGRGESGVRMGIGRDGGVATGGGRKDVHFRGTRPRASKRWSTLRPK